MRGWIVLALVSHLTLVGCESDEDCRRDPRMCHDHNACTDDLCDMDTGQCRHSEKRCNDGNPCTVDSCDPTVGCVAAPVQCDPSKGDKDPCVRMSACNDGNPCAVRFFCQSGTCATEPAPEGTTCFVGGDRCQPGTCTQGLCIKDAVVTCDDGNPCTTDSCDPALGCVHGFLHGIACDDQDPCTMSDSCVQGACRGIPKDCDDQDDATVDACDAQTGQCTHAPAI